MNYEDPTFYPRDRCGKLLVSPLSHFDTNPYFTADLNMYYCRLIGEGFCEWYELENPGIDQKYFELWQNLNMLYERLSLPWETLRFVGSERKTIREAVRKEFDRRGG